MMRDFGLLTQPTSSIQRNDFQGLYASIINNFDCYALVFACLKGQRNRGVELFQQVLVQLRSQGLSESNQPQFTAGQDGENGTEAHQRKASNRIPKAGPSVGASLRRRYLLVP